MGTPSRVAGSNCSASSGSLGSRCPGGSSFARICLRSSVASSWPAISRNVVQKLDTIAHHVRGILSALGLDLKDPNLAETDLRVAKMYVEMFHGLAEGAEPKVTTFPNEEQYSHMVMEKQIPFYSMCAHHLVPFYGHAHIAYIPRDRILGLSKFAVGRTGELRTAV